MLHRTLEFQLVALRRNRLTAALLALTGLGVLYVGWQHGRLAQAAAYLGAMWLCAFLTDLYVLRNEMPGEFVVKRPAREALIFLGCAAGGFGFLFFRMGGAGPWETLPGLLRLAAVGLIIFLFPVALAIIMLLLGYRPKGLGLRLQGLMLGLVAAGITALAAWLSAPAGFTWSAVLAESGGIVQALFAGFITAGLSEEFFRTIGQTRLGAWLGSRGLGWWLATALWALLHAPKWYHESGGDLAESLLGALRIVPIGLMWGYLTHRTRSFLPAVLAHGLNVWGLQNF